MPKYILKGKCIGSFFACKIRSYFFSVKVFQIVQESSQNPLQENFCTFHNQWCPQLPFLSLNMIFQGFQDIFAKIQYWYHSFLIPYLFLYERISLILVLISSAIWVWRILISSSAICILGVGSSVFIFVPFNETFTLFNFGFCHFNYI